MPPLNNLPSQRTGIIGRRHELEAARQLLLLDSTGLLTLTGPAGIGKTRLALQIGTDLLHEFPDGVFFVPLAPVRDAGLVPMVVASHLGVHEAGGMPIGETLEEYLRDRRTLLLLDNFEQLPEAASFVSDLLLAAPHLKIVVTSRSMLHIYGEQDFPVPGLTLPAMGEPVSLGELAGYEAVRLFVERAASVRPEFALTDQNAEAIVEICRRLDGLPLAIELAAARIRVLPPQAMRARLESRLKLLTGGPRNLPSRQQTLYSAIAWSYDLLTLDEQAIFRTLSIFRGGCTLEAAEAVCGANIVADGVSMVDVLDVLDSLAGKSLLKLEELEGAPRFMMLETIHEFAEEKLREAGEDSALWTLFAHYYLHLAELAGPEIRGPQQLEWLDRLDREGDNFRAVLSWAANAGDLATGLKLTAALYLFWSQRSYLNEGREQMARLVARAERLEPNADFALILTLSGALAYRQSDLPSARSLLERGLAVAREGGALQVVARALNGLANVNRAEGQIAVSRKMLEECLAISRELGDKWSSGITLGNLGLTAAKGGDAPGALQFYGESLAIFREMRDRGRIANTLTYMAMLAYQEADYPAMRSLYSESLAVFRELSDKYGISNSVSALGELAMHEGEYALSASLHAESLALSRELGDRWNTATALENVGHLAQREGDYGRARECYLEALLLRRSIADKRAIAACLSAIAGLVARSSGNAAVIGARLLGFAEATFALTGGPLRGLEAVEYGRNRELVQAALNGELFAEAEAEGRSLLPDEAEELASKSLLALESRVVAVSPPLQTTDLPVPRTSLATYPNELSTREVEVLRLLASGKTNPQIARHLQLSVNTIQSHLRSIYSKLGVESRTEAAHYAFRHDLI